jgi:hypothetical protein
MNFLTAALSVLLILAPQPIVIHGWMPLLDTARVTYYGPYFRGGELTASGETYYKDKKLCAVGKEILQSLRDIDTTAPGTFSIKACFKCEGDAWGWYLRLTTETKAVICQVLDTGADGLEIDLPDLVWAELMDGNYDKGVLPMKVEVFR